MIARDALACASWATLVMLPYWPSVLQPDVASDNGLRPSAEACWAAITVTGLAALLGVVFGFVFRRSTRGRFRTIKDVLVLGSVVPVIDAVRVWNSIYAPKVGAWIEYHEAVLAIAIIGVLVALVRWHHRIAGAVVWGLLIASPFVAITVVRAAVAAVSTDFTALDQRPTQHVSYASTAGPRVVVILFDELDYSLAFAHRPSSIRLPAFDELRRHSLFATNSLSPFSATSLAIPSLLAGEKIQQVLSRTNSSLFVRFENDPTVRDASTAATVFDDAATLGAQSEVVGSFLPYCRWRLAALATRCLSIPMSRGGVFDGPTTYRDAVARQLVALSGPPGMRQGRIMEMRALTDASIMAVADSSIRFVFLHLMVPHSPYIWDEERMAFTRLQIRQSGYYGNLVLADRILAQIRKSVADAHLEGRTAFIVTSDHGYRGRALNGVMAEHRVPFVVSLPSGGAMEWPGKIDMVPLRPLVRALLEGDVRTIPDLAKWLDSRSTTARDRPRT